MKNRNPLPLEILSFDADRAHVLNANRKRSKSQKPVMSRGIKNDEAPVILIEPHAAYRWDPGWRPGSSRLIGLAV
jgi:hypothetical protein